MLYFMSKYVLDMLLKILNLPQRKPKNQKALKNCKSNLRNLRKATSKMMLP